MTELETRLARLLWVRTNYYYSTVHNGLGFILYPNKGVMWATGLSKKQTATQQSIHKQKDSLVVTGDWSSVWQYAPLFNMPASNELISAVVLSAHPEILV